MKRLNSFFLILGLLLSQAEQAQQKKFSNEQLSDMIQIAAVDPLVKVFKETAYFEKTEALADVARGEHASFQFAIRSSRTLHHVTAAISQVSGKGDLFSKNSFIGFIGYTRVGRPLPYPPKDKLDPVSGFYPDPILDSAYMDIPNFTTQPIWVTVNIPKNQDPDEYTGLLQIKGVVEGQSFSLSRKLMVHIYPVTIEKTRLWVTNWFGLGKNQLKQLSGGKDSVEFEGNYWHWLGVAAKKMKDYDQNVIMTPIFSLTQIRMEGEKYHFDFDKLDHFIQLFIDSGTLERIEGSHLGGRMGNWYAQFGLYTPFWRNDTMRLRVLSLDDEITRNFYRQFIPALMEHLRQKGWDRIYLQHICDEPESGNEKSYASIAEFIKSIDPQIRIIDAVHSHQVNNEVDVWVPQLDCYDSNYHFYQERQLAGNEVWFYTCLAPQGNYANRFIEIPLIKARILHWINFRFGATGYLHWGWNFWSEDCYDETSGIIPEAGNIMPGGDAFITYPGNGKILSSIRLEAMRDGINDYELLCMLKERRPEFAKEICREVVYEFDKYDVDIKSFRAKRRLILQQLSS